MAITRFRNSSIRNGTPKYNDFQAGLPFRPAIGTATAGVGQASVAFTANNPAGAGVTYTALSSPGNITATGPASPITVTGLSNGTAYTFQVRASNSLGDSAYSASSNSVTPAPPKPVVTGGTLYSDATFYYRRFTANGTLGVTNANLIADVLIVAGGGGGSPGYQVWTPKWIGQAWGGGGGAGGLTGLTNQTISVGNTTVTIGAGGGSNANGSNSSFGATSTVGGGKGGGDSAGSSGGSGGGGGQLLIAGGGNRYNGGSGTSGQGFAGGQGGSINNPPGTVSRLTGGGGGATEAGWPGDGTFPQRQGGAGSSAYSTWASATSSGSSGAYAGGGGGCDGFSVNNGGNGGIGGGGKGGGGSTGSNPPVAGTANTGGGGGGAPYNFSTNNLAPGGAGGSGIVIVRYTRSQVD